MGCVVSSTLLNQEDETSLGHHFVSLTSTTYGFLSTLDNPTTTVPPTPASRFTLRSEPASRFTLGSEPASRFNTAVLPTPASRFALGSEPRPDTTTPDEVINSWELMAGLDSTSESFRFSTPVMKRDENSDPNFRGFDGRSNVGKVLDYGNSYNQPQDASFKAHSQGEKDAKTISNSANSVNNPLDRFEKLCPPKGENKAVIYTTTLRGVRTTFEACNAVRAAIQGLGIAVCERDISMDRSFREELRELMKGKDSTQTVPPRVFIKGRYLGGAEEVMRIVEDGRLGELLEGLPKLRAGHVCEGCGDVRFLPCFGCNGSCKMVMVMKEDCKDVSQERTVVVRCPDCNENGLVLCPICS